MMVICEVCRERVALDSRGRWYHPHSGDAECWTGDGSTAYPSKEASD